ncbi:MAG: hypothetical protein U9O86_07285 [Campylobacterota bacterium]|nr:hypothetical protein [Campylobacterota bacterium]
MNEIKISVDDKNLETVLTLLNNLKDGLISNISTNGQKATTRPPQYQPKTNTIIKEENSGTNDTSGKYANANAYRQRLKAKK